MVVAVIGGEGKRGYSGDWGTGYKLLGPIAVRRSLPCFGGG
jgi:hypothetical protein